MALNLDHLLETSKKGQWSPGDLDWDTPLQGAERLSRRERDLLGLVLLFTAGVEKLGAHAFRVNARNSHDPVVRELFEIIAGDEDRHAEAETRLAGRLGVEWEELPPFLRLSFRLLSRDLRRLQGKRSRIFHEIVGTQIILFELGLDALWSPTIKEMLQDPFQNEVIRLIDRDEARHLAMDYWLLEQKGQGYQRTRLSARKILRNLPVRLQSAAIGMAAFLVFFWTVRDLDIKSERFDDYWNRVLAIREKAPNSGRFPPHRDTVTAIKQAVEFFSEHKVLFRGFMLGITGRRI